MRILAALLVSFVVSNARPADARGLDDLSRFEAVADSLMTAGLARNHVPGGVLVAVRDTGIVFARGYGYADLGRRQPVDPERTIFRIASVSKLFTATAAMQLVEQGVLRLDTDVNGSLKRFPIPRAGFEPVTLRHLLTHTAGFDDRNIDRKARTAADMESLGAYLARRMPPRIMAPERWISYSNHGVALAGVMIEDVTGVPFAQYMSENVFAPLGMTRSTFALHPLVPADLATGCDDSDPPRPVPIDYVKTVPSSMMTATGIDVAQFMIAHLQAGHGAARILGPDAMAEMHRRQFSQDSLLPGVTLGFWERFQNGERALWHDGDGPGFTSLLYLLPDSRTAFFLAFNGMGGNAAREEILAALLDRFYPDQRPAPAPVTFADGAAESRRCQGIYVFNRHGHRSMEKLITLTSAIEVMPDSGGTLSFRNRRYAAVAPLRFRRIDGRGDLVFATDAGGRVDRLYAGGAIARVYERVPDHVSPPAILAVLAFCVVVFAGSLIAWPVSAIVRHLRRRPRNPASRTVKVARALGAVNLLFMAGLAPFLVTFASTLVYGVPPLLAIVMALPFLSVALGIVCVVMCIRDWRQKAGDLSARIHVTLAAVAGLAFVAFLTSFNLIGFRF
jgi:CubicO group peptidase (beta-lactamase class C family)